MIKSIKDNGGKTADRYTVFIDGGIYLTLSENPENPWHGVSQIGYGEESELEGENEITLQELPEKVKDHLLRRLYNDY